MRNTPDSLIAKKVKLGNKNAFDALFFKYYKSLFRFAFNFCKDAELAEDSVQKTFIKIWQNHTEFPLKDTSKILFTYTKNNLIDEIRKEKVRKKYEELMAAELVLEKKDEVDYKYQVKAILESGIEILPKRAKEIFRLAKQEGLTIKEISTYLNISTKTVENQLTIAYKKMRKYLEPFKNDLNF